MFLTKNKLQSRMEELKEYRYRSVNPMKEFLVQEDVQGVVNPKLPSDFSGFDKMSVGETWKGRNKYLWLHKTIKIPNEMKGKKAVGIFDFGNTGGGNNSGFESLLFVNGQPYQGVDMNHKEVFFGEELIGTNVDLTFRLWSGLEGGGIPCEQEHKIARADLAWLDEAVDHFYYLGTMIVGALKQISNLTPVWYELQTALDEACLCIDWAVPGSDDFYESIHKAEKQLSAKLKTIDRSNPVSVKCVGHTHIDVAWLWQLKHTREKVSRSFATVLKLMEQYPEYVFLQTQPQLYEYIKNDFPEIYEKIKEKVADGQWEADGGMWVEADCNLTSGESLVRQLLIGGEFIKNEFGKDISYLWLPDVFGYSWALPQILKKSGIDTFMTTKISWNQYNRMPHDTFYWKGIDGSQVLTHFITTPEPWSEPGSWFYTYNGRMEPLTVKGVWDAYSEKEWNQELLISYGYGDGGGGVNRDMLEQRRCMQEIPGLPTIETATARSFFDDLHKTAQETNRHIHTWDGELYLEYHRGTYTSHAHNKRMNRSMEQRYRRAEWMTVMHALLKNAQAKDILEAAAQEKLTEGWKRILTEQFHDIIPGSSIFEVYEDSKKDYEEINQIAADVEEAFLKDCVAANDNCFTVVNTGAFLRSGLVRVPGKKNGSYTDAAGNELLTQHSEDAVFVAVEKVPSMGQSFIYYKESENGQAKSSFTVQEKQVETPFYLMTLNGSGQIERLYDKLADREVLPEGERANVLQMFEDKPLGNDAWDIDIFYQEKMREVTGLTEFSVKEEGPLRLVLHFKWQYMSSTISQDMILYAKDRRIDFETVVDYHERHQLLKAAFPVDIRSTYATYDIQYGNVRRPNHWNTSWDMARFETVAHRFVDLSEHGYGVSLLNNCKYGHDVKENVMRITLLKAATHPDHSQDQGEHVFTYALLPHMGDFVEGNTVSEAFDLNEELLCVNGKLEGYESFLSFDCETVELDAVKKSQDGKYLVIRFHEFAGGRQTIALKTGFSYQAWAECDLRERPLSDTFTNGEIELLVKPYEIKTILLKL